ncbi:MAG: hypothetical protein ACYTFY_07255 [Planctomycetota bacterium]|jgi:hypothetical protein
MLQLADNSRIRIAFKECGENICWEKEEVIYSLAKSTWQDTVKDLNTPLTTVKSFTDNSGIYFRFDCSANKAQFLAGEQSAQNIQKRDHIFICLSPYADNSIQYQFCADLRGVKLFQKISSASGEKTMQNVTDSWTKTETVKCSSEYVNLKFGVGGGFWFAEVFIAWDIMGLSKRPANIGLKFGRVFKTGVIYPDYDSVVWPARTPESNELSTSEALIGTESGCPEKIELEKVNFGKNSGTFVPGDSWVETPASVISLVLAGEEIISEERSDFSAGKFTFTLDRKYSDYADLFGGMKLHLEFTDKDDKVLYCCRYSIGRHTGIIKITEPYSDDSCDAGQFSSRRDQMIFETATKLPKLSRATTLKGAPSDFCLISKEDNIQINLAHYSAWQELAEIIKTRFTEEKDILPAAMLLVGQKSVTNLITMDAFFNESGKHSYHSASHELMGPLSILRYGGGTAACRAAVLARLLQEFTDSRGEIYQTRVIISGKDGGPNQVKNTYSSASQGSNLVQDPGIYSFVVVSCSNGYTLLDPSSMAFFIGENENLADLCAIINNDEIRNAGSGVMSEIYAKLNIEEIMRQPVNQLLSRGVFPELFTDEDGTDRPLDFSMHRKALNLTSGKGSLSGFTDKSGAKGLRDAEVSAEVTEYNLVFNINVTGVNPEHLNEKDREYERIHLLLDAENNNVSFHHLVIDIAGNKEFSKESYNTIQTLFKYNSSAQRLIDQNLSADNIDAAVSENETGYSVKLTIPAKSLKCEKFPAVTGFNVIIDGRNPHYEQLMLSPARFRHNFDPFSFAKLYRCGGAVTVESLDFDVPVWGESTVKAVLKNNTTEDLAVEIKVDNEYGMINKYIELPKEKVVLAAGKSSEVEFKFYINPEEKMTNGQAQKSSISFSSGGENIYKENLYFSYCTAPGVYVNYNLNPDSCSQPESGEEGFAEKKVRYICSRINVFNRVTNRDGAKSDFVIKSKDGSVEFNFMEEGVLEKMARWIEGLFDNDVDRVLGMLYLCHNPAVARHMSSGHRYNKGSGPLNLIRLNFAGGGGNCGFHSRIFAGMAARLKLGGERLVAHTTGVYGHCISAFAWRGSKVLIDADVGHFFLNEDGSDFITIDEMQAGLPMISTASSAEFGRYLVANAVSLKEAFSILIDEPYYNGIWPENAPRE